MSIADALDGKRPDLNGRPLSAAETDRLVARFGAATVPPWLVSLLQRYPLADVTFTLDESDDASGLGADMTWYDADRMIEEAFDYYPGISVCKRPYLPVATCNEGSGDPYFFDMRAGAPDPPLVRVPHDEVPANDDNEPYPEDAIEIVSATLSGFFAKAGVG